MISIVLRYYRNRQTSLRSLSISFFLYFLPAAYYTCQEKVANWYLEEKKMWVCPKCGRSFKNTNQQHYCGKAPNNVDEYIKMQEPEIQPYLLSVHKAIQEAIPSATVKITWSMPTYYKRKSVISFAAHKKHIGLYVGDAIIQLFKERLSACKVNKGTIHIPYSNPFPTQLIGDIAKQCYEAYE